MGVFYFIWGKADTVIDNTITSPEQWKSNIWVVFLWAFISHTPPMSSVNTPLPVTSELYPLSSSLFFPACVQCVCVLSALHRCSPVPFTFRCKIGFSLSRIARDYPLLLRSAELAAGITSDPFSAYFRKRWNTLYCTSWKAWALWFEGKIASKCARSYIYKQNMNNSLTERV